MNYEALKNNRFVRYSYYMMKGIVAKSKYIKEAERTLERFCVVFEQEKKKEVIKDMVRTKTFYGFEFDEYLLYGFHEKSKKERLSFVADWEHLGYTCAMNNAKNEDIYDNKWETYKKYQEYYGRDVFFCEKTSSFEKFEEFLKGKESFIVKPLNASCGNGIQVFVRNSFSSDHELWEALLKEYSGSFLAEELLEQVSEMAKFHPKSLNTVRVPTIRLDDETIIVHPFMRIGQHGKVVDNAGAGGIICAIDVQTGEIIAAADEYGKTFVEHPETQERIIGFEVPNWEEAKVLVKKLAEIVPDNKYTGWDIALTKEGWKLVEANRRGQFVWQIPLQAGFRKEIDAILKKMGKKY